MGPYYYTHLESQVANTLTSSDHKKKKIAKCQRTQKTLQNLLFNHFILFADDYDGKKFKYFKIFFSVDYLTIKKERKKERR